MILKELLQRYNSDAHFKQFVKSFPRMYEFAGEVEVIPWQEEYAIADKNPELIDELRFYEELRKNNLITEDEFKRKRNSISHASKTLAIAFIQNKKVAFREKAPPLPVILHELGHIYFEEPDPVWSAIYGGGEALMWLILEGKVKGNEDSIRRWHELLRLAYIDSEEALKLLDWAALRLGKKLSINFLETEKDFPPNIPKRPVYAMMLWAGTIPSPDAGIQAILINIIEGVRWGEYIYTEFLKELTSPSPKKTQRVMIRITPDERRKWEEEARRKGMTLSEWIRETIRKYLR